MTRTIATAALALSASLLVGSLAGAQAAPRSKNAPAGKLIASTDSTAAPAKPVAAASVTFAQLNAVMSALPDQSGRFVRIRGLRPEHITLVDVRNLFRYTDDQKSYEQALMGFERQITEMRSTLQSSMVLRDLLYDRQLRMSQVVGVEARPDGRAIVFYQPE